MASCARHPRPDLLLPTHQYATLALCDGQGLTQSPRHRGSVPLNDSEWAVRPTDQRDRAVLQLFVDFLQAPQDRYPSPVPLNGQFPLGQRLLLRVPLSLSLGPRHLPRSQLLPLSLPLSLPLFLSLSLSLSLSLALSL